MSRNLKNKLKKIMPLFFRIYKRRKDDQIQNNFFETNFSKTVLISYLTIPNKPLFSHTNTEECLIIARCFNKLGYDVDLVNSTYKRKIEYSKYKIVFGSGYPLAKSFSHQSSPIRKIFYGPGMHPHVNNQNTLTRLRDFYKKTGKFLIESARYIDHDYLLETACADNLLILGNKLTLESYRKYNRDNIFLIPPFFYKVADYKKILRDKNFDEARNHFLFISGSGMIHKGLDLLLDYFYDNQKIHLHVCAPVKAEENFYNYNKERLFGRENIHYYDFVDIQSLLFNNLLKQCAFVIFPSCSEGGGVSAITAMGNGGLIPIVTKESSIPVSNYGLMIAGFSKEDIAESINQAQGISTKKLVLMSSACGHSVNENNSLLNYSRSVELSLKEIIQKI